MGVGAFDEDLVCLIDGKHLQSMIFTGDNRKKGEIRELVTAIMQVDESANMPRLRVDDVNTVRIPDKSDGVLARMEVRRPL